MLLMQPYQFYLAYERTWQEKRRGVGGPGKVSLRRDFLHHQSHVTLDTDFLQEVEGGGAGDR